ncbi:MAG: biopolymer transporter ExbD [Lentisphaerae bacterium]|nr:MAG: biopolymer transporter ExbD [Lentisphaerota bacterium]
MSTRKKRNKGDEKLDPPMSAMIDVVFLLLIFFIATFKEHKVEAHVAINLPTPNLAQPNPDAQFLEIYVLKDTYLLMGTTPVNVTALESKLINVASNDTNYTIMIKTHPDAPEERLVKVLDLCAKAGLHNLNVLTLKK